MTRSNSTQDAAIDIASSSENEDDEDDKEEVKRAINKDAHRIQQHKSQFVMIAPGNLIQLNFIFQYLDFIQKHFHR